MGRKIVRIKEYVYGGKHYPAFYIIDGRTTRYIDNLIFEDDYNCVHYIKKGYFHRENGVSRSQTMDSESVYSICGFIIKYK